MIRIVEMLKNIASKSPELVLFSVALYTYSMCWKYLKLSDRDIFWVCAILVVLTTLFRLITASMFEQLFGNILIVILVTYIFQKVLYEE